jgi:hypothetical protein
VDVSALLAQSVEFIKEQNAATLPYVIEHGSQATRRFTKVATDEYVVTGYIHRGIEGSRDGLR